MKKKNKWSKKKKEKREKKKVPHLKGMRVEGSVVCAASSMIAVSKARSSRSM